MLSQISVNAQTLLYQLNNQYNTNFIKTAGNDSTCYIINITPKEQQTEFNQKNKSIYTFKVFCKGFLVKKKETETEEKKIVLFDTLKKKIDDILTNSLSLNTITLKNESGTDYQMLFDNLIVIGSDSIYSFNGKVLVNYYILKDFKQFSPLQSNSILINTNSIITKFEYSKDREQDSIPLRPISPNFLNYTATGKIYLIAKKKSKQEFTFCRYIVPIADDNYHKTELFTYKINVGIIGFKGRYIYSSKFILPFVGPWSLKYFDFRPVKYLIFN